MAHIIHRVGIKGAIEKVYEALATPQGIAGWWSQETSGASGPGQMINIRFATGDGKELGSMEIEVQELLPNKKVSWLFKHGPQEWLGTDVQFDLKREDDYTIVLFSHNNWAAEVEFKAHCSMKWAIFLLSLKQMVETGKGNPSPYDIKIDNWN